MGTFDDLQKNRKLISKMLKKETDGEIVNFDFIVSHISFGKPIVTFLLAVPAVVKRDYRYNGGEDAILDKHMETIRQVVSAAGFPEVFSRSVSYHVL